MADIKLKIDVVEGTLDVECSGEDFESVMLHAEKVLEKFSSSGAARPKRTEDAAESEADFDPVEMEPQRDVVSEPAKPKRKRGTGKSKSTNWKIIDDLLNENQRKQLQEFYQEKQPGRQNDQVAVLAFKLKQLLERDAFDGNEIHTAFQVVGVKTPANLAGVFSNMTGEGLGKVEEKRWTPNFKSDDFVNHDLPASQ